MSSRPNSRFLFSLRVAFWVLVFNAVGSLGADWIRPGEVELSVVREPDSAPLEYCILTATMGNMARTRQLWLSDEVVSSLKVYADYKDKGFAPHVLDGQKFVFGITRKTPQELGFTDDHQ